MGRQQGSRIQRQTQDEGRTGASKNKDTNPILQRINSLTKLLRVYKGKIKANVNVLNRNKSRRWVFAYLVFLSISSPEKEDSKLQRAQKPQIFTLHEYYTPKLAKFQENLSIFTIFVYYAYFYVNIIMLTYKTKTFILFAIFNYFSRCCV